MIQYINKETGKEVLYGEPIVIKKSFRSEDNAFTYEGELKVYINNTTLPMLIKEGIIIQKEKEKKDSKNETNSACTNNKQPKYCALEEQIKELKDRINDLEAGITRLSNRILVMKELFTNNKEDYASSKKKWATGRV